MFATVRRYEGVDTSRTDELTKKVNENLIPKLSKLPGFDGYFLIEAGNGVMTSVSLFDTSAHADESTGVASSGCATRSWRARFRIRRRSPSAK